MTVHPDTLERLKNELPGVRTLAALFGLPDGQEAVSEAVDELRENFPGVDDLTLASFLTYGVKNFTGHDSLEMLAMAVSFAQMALQLVPAGWRE